MFTHRALENSDTEIIVTFPQSAQELFHMFPRAIYPLTPDALIKEAGRRFHPTVVMVDNQLAGYGNFITAEYGRFCTIGNVVVHPEMRRKGIASYLVKTLTSIACNSLRAKYVKISCFTDNAAGLFLYHKLGFIPISMEPRQGPDGNKIMLLHMHKNGLLPDFR